MYVYLGISNFKEDPSEISKLVGVSPSKTFRKGEQIGKSKLRHKANGWQYRVDATLEFDLDPIVNSVLSAFKDKDALKRAITLGDGTIVCGLYTYDRMPTIVLEEATIRSLANLGCRFWLDYYLIPAPDVT